MPYLPSLPEKAALVDVFRAYPDTAGPLIDYHEVPLRGPSPLGVADRELITAYVSGVNSCGYRRAAQLHQPPRRAAWHLGGRGLFHCLGAAVGRGRLRRAEEAVRRRR